MILTSKLHNTAKRIRNPNIPFIHFPPSLSLTTFSLSHRRNGMASITCSPTSLQLRLAFAAPRFPLAPHVRMRNLNRNRVRPLRAERDGAASEWTGSNLDGFSGWSDTDAEQRTDEKKESYGGECVLQNCTPGSQLLTV